MYLTKQEKCRIQTTEPGIPNVGLGKYLDGYDSSRESKPIALLIITGIITLPFFALGIVCLYYSIAPSSTESRLAMAIFGTIFLALVSYCAWSPLKPFMRKEMVYVYENGFLWSIQWRNGKVIKEYRVCFDDVASISCPRTQRYTNGIYSGTEYRFKVIGKDNKELCFRKGIYKNKHESPDKNGWNLFSLEAILNRWTVIGVKNMTRELNEKGQVAFIFGKKNKVVLTRDDINLGDKSLALNDISLAINNGYLNINSASKDKKWYNFNDITINVNEMPNGRIFLYMLSSMTQKE